jgi:hypothetical protein
MFYRQNDGEIRVTDKPRYLEGWQFNVGNVARQYNLEGKYDTDRVFSV